MNTKNNLKRNQNQQDNNYNEDNYRGCWNCMFHNDADGFVNDCIEQNKVYLRCPHWVLDENK